MEKLSIIIPAYNAEEYIARCLDSILDQDYHNDIEIIIVNDGSTDSTGDILKDYCFRYPDLIRIITKENGGVSSARNIGVDAATGEWIWFCDADDYICKNGLSYVLDHFVDADIDICTFWSITLDSIAQKSFIEPSVIDGKCIYEGKTVSKFIKSSPGSVCDHLYRLNAIRDVRFRSLPIGEDILFDMEVYLKDLRIRCTNTNIYRYTVNHGQATRRRDPGAMRRAIEGYEVLFDTAKQIQWSKSNDSELFRVIDRWIAGTFTPYFSRLLSANLAIKEFSEIIWRLKQKGIFPICEIEKKHKLFNFIGRHPSLYPIVGFFHRRLFVPYILPKLSRN